MGYWVFGVRWRLVFYFFKFFVFLGRVFYFYFRGLRGSFFLLDAEIVGGIIRG